MRRPKAFVYRFRTAPLKGTVSTLLNLTSLIGIIVSLSLWIRIGFWFEIIATYTPQLMLFSAALLLLAFSLTMHVGIVEGWRPILLGAKSRLLATMLIILVFGQIVFVSYVVPVRAMVDDSVEQDISVMTFNKLYRNDEYQQIVNHIHLEDPDVIAFQEIYSHEAELLAKRLGYENWHIAACGCSAYGSDLAIFSKFPIISSDMAFEDTLGGALRAEIELGVNNTLVVYSVHITPPYKQKYYGLRGEMFDKLNELVSLEADPVIVMGDFNSSPQAIDLRRFASGEHELSMVAEQKPWSKCSWFMFSELFCARIDHVFIPADATATSQDIGPNIGSDHRAVSVGVSF